MQVFERNSFCVCSCYNTARIDEKWKEQEEMLLQVCLELAQNQRGMESLT